MRTVDGRPVSRWLTEIQAIDRRLYLAVAETPPSALDPFFANLSKAADKSKLWVGVAAVLCCTNAQGRRAAAHGLVAAAATSAVVNLGAKKILRRPRPDRVEGRAPSPRHVQMPSSTSFPSGHAASAFAFSTAVTALLPETTWPLRTAAVLVAYSRVHTGVHHPVDVLAGALIGCAIAPAVPVVLRRWSAPTASTGTPLPFGDARRACHRSGNPSRTSSGAPREPLPTRLSREVGGRASRT